MKIFPFPVDRAEDWDKLCRASGIANFLQTRAFLSYHLDRFVDASLIVTDDKDALVGLFPAAISPSDPGMVVSHPGSTYGGLIYKGRVGVSEVANMLDAVISWYKVHGLDRLLYKTMPAHVQQTNSAIDQYLLWQRGRLVRRDLWNAIQLNDSRSLSKGRKWGVNRGRKNGLTASVAENPQEYREYYQILVANLIEKHGTEPVHSFEEFCEVSRRFPRETALWLARDASGSLVAGVWLFRLNPYCIHTQYIASTERGRDIAAVDFLLESIIQASIQDEVRWLSFGASTEQGGTVVNEGLFDFKSGFGVGSMTQDFFEIVFA